jgi:hypothetical protein
MQFTNLTLTVFPRTDTEFSDIIYVRAETESHSFDLNSIYRCTAKSISEKLLVAKVFCQSPYIPREISHDDYVIYKFL